MAHHTYYERCEIIPRDSIHYLKFIPDFLTVAYPLTKLTQKDEKFVWGESQQQALVTTPMLCYPTEKGRYIVDIDAPTASEDEGLGLTKDRLCSK